MPNNEIFEIIKSYGLPIVAFVLLVIWLKPKADEVWTYFIATKTKHELTERQIKAMSVDAILKFDLKIKALLNELLKSIECDWVQLWQFHNGVYSLGLPHIPFLYISITHEVTEVDVEPMSRVFRSIPTSFFRDAVEKWGSDDIVITNLHDGVSDASRTYALGALANSLLPIRNGEGKLAALLSVGYRKEHTFTADEIVEMKSYARRLGIFLATELVIAESSAAPVANKTPPFGIRPMVKK